MPFRARASASPVATVALLVALAILVALSSPVRAADSGDETKDKPEPAETTPGTDDTAPPEDDTAPAEDDTAPPEDSTAPPEDDATTATGESSSGEGESAPTPEDTVPGSNDTFLPPDDTAPTTPDDTFLPPDGTLPVGEDRDLGVPGKDVILSPGADDVPFPGPAPFPDDMLFPGDDPFFSGDIPGWMPFELNERALSELLLEIALLHELDGFEGGQPARFADIHAAYGPWPEDTSREQTLALLFAVDDDLAEIKNEVNAAAGTTPSLAFALDEIPAVQRARLTNGERSVVPVQPYTSAFHDLATFGSAAQLRAEGILEEEIGFVLPDILGGLTDAAAINELRATNAQVQVPTADLSSRLDAIDGEPTDGAPWLTILAIAGVGLIAGILITLLILRRRRDEPESRDVVTELIWEAHRRLSGATEEKEVVRIGTTTAVAITDSVDAYLFRVDDDGLRRAGTDVVITHSVLLRVAETAQPLLTELRDDAAVGTAAVCAVPLVSDGTMAGVIVTRREFERPYGPEHRQGLELLAPALGGALLSADQLGSFENLAMVDGLTSLGNRRRLDGDLETTLADAIANDLPVAFAMIDVDYFKQFNDTHGHEAGDVALQSVARIIEETVRATDVVYRYGGEEFSVLLPGATIEEAHSAGERMRAAVEAATIPGGETQPAGRLTISVGISTLDAGPPDGLKSRADDALYRAKAQGRNRSVVA